MTTRGTRDDPELPRRRRRVAATLLAALLVALLALPSPALAQYPAVSTWSPTDVVSPSLPTTTANPRFAAAVASSHGHLAALRDRATAEVRPPGVGASPVLLAADPAGVDETSTDAASAGALATSRGVVVIGTPARNGFTGGAAVWTYDATNAEYPTAAILASSDGKRGWMGASVATDGGDVIALGAPRDSNDAGAAYVFAPTDRIGCVSSAAIAADAATYSLPMNGVGRYVYVTKGVPGVANGATSTAQTLSLPEVEALDANGANLALGKPVVASHALATGTPSNLVDGVASSTGTWASVANVATGAMWFRIDLGEEKSVASVKVHNRVDCCGAGAIGARVALAKTDADVDAGKRCPSKPWREVARLRPPTQTPGDRYGAVVAVHGGAAPEQGWLAIAAPGAESGAGVVYAYSRFVKNGSPTGWTLAQTLRPSSASAPLGFGAGVAITGRYLAILATPTLGQTGHGAGGQGGRVEMFILARGASTNFATTSPSYGASPPVSVDAKEGRWLLDATLTPSVGATQTAAAGPSNVALGGETLAVAYPGVASDGTGGAARVWRRTYKTTGSSLDPKWIFQGKINPPSASVVGFGRSVARDEATIAVGAAAAMSGPAGAGDRGDGKAHRFTGPTPAASHHAGYLSGRNESSPRRRGPGGRGKD